MSRREVKQQLQPPIQKAATGLPVSLATTLTCTAVPVFVGIVSRDVPVGTPAVVLSIAVSVPVAPPVSVGAPGAAVVPVPIEVLISHPEALVELGIDIVPPVLPKRGVLATVPVRPVH